MVKVMMFQSQLENFKNCEKSYKKSCVLSIAYISMYYISMYGC